MLKKLLLLAACFAPLAGAESFYEKTQLISANSSLFPAKGFGTCTWDSTHDVGTCINLAIAKAATNGGGTVVLPCGTFGLSTQVENHTSGVRLQGCGNGIPRDTGTPSNFLSVTRLKWVGSVTANPALVVQTATGGGTPVSSADVVGITVDCDNICGIAIRINGVSFSQFNIGGSEATSTNIEFTTPTDLEGGGNQHNDIWAWSRSTSSSNSPTGILFDGGCASCFNTSYNTIHQMFAWYNKGDGIVFGDSDNNTVELLRTFPNTGATGSSAVCANSLYTPPNGVAVKNYCRQLRILHTGGKGLHVTGFQTNSTFTATGGNGGSAALNPLTLVTSASSAQSASTLTFTDTTGAVAGESISCGGPVHGVFSGLPLGVVTATTLTISPAQFVTTVPSSTSCILTYGFTQFAANGTYTLTATSSTLYTLTAPSGGHTQSGISVSGGVLTFTDMIIPWTGTPSTNDSWSIVVPNPATDVIVEFIDKGNNLPSPSFEAGAAGSYRNSDALYPIGYGNQCVIATATPAGGKSTAAGVSACAIGGESGVASGEAATVLGGSAGVASGFASTVTGQNNTASAPDTFAWGFQTSASGGASMTGGANSADRGRPGSTCMAYGKFSTSGDAQTCAETLRGTGSSTSAIRITADALTAGTTNCINIPNNTAFALSMEIVAFDHTTVSKSASWGTVTGLLTRGANAASTALSVLSAAPSVSYSNGTLTGNAMSLTADTTFGCLNISWTPPSANTDTWNVVARIVTIEVQ